MTDKQEQLQESEVNEEPSVTATDEMQASADATPGEPETSEKTEPSAENQTELLKDQLLRTMADFENFKKRKQKEFADLIQNANEKLIVDLLPVIDDLERALKTSKELQVDNPAVQQAFQGFDFIYKKLIKVLGACGLKPMDCVGKPFNAELHDALMQVETADKESDLVVDEHEKGYYLNDKVIRHAKVIVSK